MMDFMSLGQHDRVPHDVEHGVGGDVHRGAPRAQSAQRRERAGEDAWLRWIDADVRVLRQGIDADSQPADLLVHSGDVVADRRVRARVRTGHYLQQASAQVDATGDRPTVSSDHASGYIPVVGTRPRVALSPVVPV
jgi:hypothetical protein